MPPVKSRMTIMVDPDVAEFFEERYQAEVVSKAQAKKRVPSFSEYMNDLLRNYMQREKAEEPKGLN